MGAPRIGYFYRKANDESLIGRNIDRKVQFAIPRRLCVGQPGDASGRSNHQTAILRGFPKSMYLASLAQHTQRNAGAEHPNHDLPRELSLG